MKAWRWHPLQTQLTGSVCLSELQLCPGPVPALADVEIRGPVGISALTVLITANSP